MTLNLDVYNMDDWSKKQILYTIEQIKQNKREGAKDLLYFEGEYGTGKSTLATDIMKQIGKPVLYLGFSDAPFDHAKDIEDFLTKMKDYGFLLIDDIVRQLNKTECMEVCSEHQRIISKIMANIKGKLLIITNDPREHVDHANTRPITLGLPKFEHKMTFLKDRQIPDELKNIIATNSCGYNFHEINDTLTSAIIRGNGKMSKESINKTLNNYIPAALYGYGPYRIKDISLKDVLRKDVASNLKKIIALNKNKRLVDKLGIRRANLLLFHGPPGTGKTFAAKTIAGELGYPLISIKTADIINLSPYASINNAVNLTKVYDKCVLLFDDIDKLMGNQTLGDDNPYVGEINKAIESISNGEVQSILVMTANDIVRLGFALPDRFTTMEFKLPDYDERRSYLATKPCPVEIDLDYFAKITDEKSFREIDRIWNNIMYAYMDKQEITNELIFSLVREKTQEIMGVI